MQEAYEKFLTTKQEALKLRIALEEFFSNDNLEERERRAYETYLQKRIRPAIEVLIEKEEAEKILQLESLGWFRESELEHFLDMAGKKGRPVSWMTLLKIKKEKYGFHDRDFSL